MNDPFVEFVLQTHVQDRTVEFITISLIIMVQRWKINHRTITSRSAIHYSMDVWILGLVVVVESFRFIDFDD